VDFQVIDSSDVIAAVFFMPWGSDLRSFELVGS
jgi:hypothetical protein